MKSFKDLVFEHFQAPWYGKKSKMFFDNGYGVSVVSSFGSYGGNLGLYEVAVLSHSGEIICNTPITNDVIGYLSKSDVSRIMKEIQQLPAINN